MDQINDRLARINLKQQQWVKTLTQCKDWH